MCIVLLTNLQKACKGSEQEANCVLSGLTNSPGHDSRSRDRQPKVSKTSNEPRSFLQLPSLRTILNQSILAGQFFVAVFGEHESRMFVVPSKLDWWITRCQYLLMTFNSFTESTLRYTFWNPQISGASNVYE